MKRRQYVYLFKMEGTNFYKIGIAQNVESRRNSIQTGSPLPVVVVCEALADDARKEERKLHAAFRPFLKQGEWFELSENMAELAASRIGTIRAIHHIREDLSITLRAQLDEIARRGCDDDLDE